MKWVCKLFRQDPNSREGLMSAASMLGIVVNLFIASAKVVIGFLADSIAIISEGANNASDALSAVLMLVGTKLAGKQPDKEHPFGHGRVEYLTGLGIALVILVTGVDMVIKSIERIIHPEELKISVLSLVIIAVSAVIKFALGTFTLKVGETTESDALVGVGKDCRNDSYVSTVTILSALIFLLFGKSVDAYAGLFTSLLILKAGLDILHATIGDLIGRPGEKELAEKLYKEILATDGVLGAADMMLHNYGPGAFAGSVNVEIDHSETVGDVYQYLHALQLRIMHEYHVTMVFGVYAVDSDHEEVKQIRLDIAEFVLARDHVRNFHAVYLEPDTNRIYCDLIVDYDLPDRHALREEFTEYMRKKYPENPLELTIETEFV